jgi:hypothetical protein
MVGVSLIGMPMRGSVQLMPLMCSTVWPSCA